MSAADIRPPTLLAGPPIHPMLTVAATTCFVGTLLSDIAYWRSANILWADFSTWLVTAGFAVALAALAAFVFDYVDGRVLRASATWPYAAALLAVLILAVLDMLVHTRDAWTGVVPWGLTLSAVIVVMALVAGWTGRSMVYRYGVAV
jgi:uncharacterized membrane protein